MNSLGVSVAAEVTLASPGLGVFFSELPQGPKSLRRESLHCGVWQPRHKNLTTAHVPYTLRTPAINPKTPPKSAP